MFIAGLIAFLLMRRRKQRRERRAQRERDDMIFNSHGYETETTSNQQWSPTMMEHTPTMAARAFPPPGTAGGMDSERYYVEPEPPLPVHHYNNWSPSTAQQPEYYPYMEDHSTVSGGPDYAHEQYYNATAAVGGAMAPQPHHYGYEQHHQPTSPVAYSDPASTSPTMQNPPSADYDYYHQYNVGGGAAGGYYSQQQAHQPYDKPDAKDGQ